MFSVVVEPSVRGKRTPGGTFELQTTIAEIDEHAPSQAAQLRDRAQAAKVFGPHDSRRLHVEREKLLAA
jgi:hypothetical protein